MEKSINAIKLQRTRTVDNLKMMLKDTEEKQVRIKKAIEMLEKNPEIETLYDNLNTIMFG